MSKNLGLTCLIFVFLVAGSTAEENTETQAEEILSAQELLDGCEEGASPGVPNQYCMRYVFGLVQTLDMLQQQGESPKIFCINPHKTRLEEVTDKITIWLRDKHERLTEDAYILVTEALNEMYPCNIIDA